MKLPASLALALSCAAFVPAPSAAGPVLRPQLVPPPVILTALPDLPGPEALADQPALPDPLLLPDGKRIGSTRDWDARRAELKKVLMYYATGVMPAAPGNVTGRVLSSTSVLDGTVKYQLIHLSFGPGQKLGFDIGLYTPMDKAGPFPTVVFLSYQPAPGAEPLATQPRRPEQGKGGDSLAIPLGIPAADPEAKPAERTDPAKVAEAHRELFKRGYALALYNYQDTGEDTIARNEDGSWAFRNTRFYPAYPGHDWGLLGGWAWGLSRCIDFLETQAEVDKTRLIATGHSRLGKAVLVAGAFDERIALSAPAGSAGGGVGAYRFCGFGRSGGEGLDDMTRKYPNWFSPKLRAFGAHADRLPFDQHWFVALTAPRGFLVLDGDSDRICSPTAVRKSLQGAEPVYALYGATDRLGLHYSPHGHAFDEADWAALIDFADASLGGRKPARDFSIGTADARPLVLNVRMLGAAADGTTKDTGVFQRAFDRCFAAGGGEVLVPAGDYLIGAVQLRSHTTLRFEKGARLIGSPDIADYPLERIRWEGQWETGHRALLNATDADQIAIIGPGHIAGAVPLGRLRNPRAPALIEPIHCAGVRLEGFSTTYANMWCIHPTRCRDVVALNLTLRSGGGNGDGIDVDSCRNVRIEHCDIDTGDDPIALKSGRGLEGYLADEPTENVYIANCTLADANYACIGIGSEMSGSVRNVLIERCTFTHAKTNAIYIKGRPGRAGVIENIEVRDVDVLSSEGAFLRINLRQSGKEGPDPVPGLEGIPEGRNFRFSNIRIANCGMVVEATLTNPEKPIEGLSLVGITGTSKGGLDLANIRNVELRDINVKISSGALIKAENTTGTGLPEPGTAPSLP